MLACSIDLAINELEWKPVATAKFMEVQARRLLVLEFASSHGNWEVASKIEESHMGHEVNEAALIQQA